MPNTHRPIRVKKITRVAAVRSLTTPPTATIYLRGPATGLSSLGPDREALVELSLADLADVISAVPRPLMTPEEYARLLRAADILRAKGPRS